LAIFSVAAAHSAEAANLHDGLVAYWPLDDGTGITASDLAPGGIEADDGQLRGSPTWLSGGAVKLGTSALQFDGATQDVLLSDSFDLDINSSAVTVSAWINTSVLPSGLVGSFGGIFDSDNDAYVLYLDKAANELRFKVTDSNGTAERPGDWHHVMGVYDGASVAKIYYDGVAVDAHSNNALIDAVRTGQIAGIGSNPTAAAPNDGTNFFPGSIDDVAVWNRALGAAEAAYLYNGGVGQAVGAANADILPIAATKPTATPVVYYPFEGSLQNFGSGGAAYDGVLSDNPGTNDPLYDAGKFGQGLDLRDNPDAVTGGDFVSTPYVLTDNGTIAFHFAADKLYNFQSLFTNSVGGNDWEMWIYGDSRVAARADAGTTIADFDLDILGGVGNTYHMAFTWERDGDSLSVALYVDGELRETMTGVWQDPGSTFYIGGDGGANDYGSGVFDDFRIYDVALSATDIQYLSQVPEPSSILLVVAAVGAIAAGHTVRRRR
jgi:hypothetical protein